MNGYPFLIAAAVVAVPGWAFGGRGRQRLLAAVLVTIALAVAVIAAVLGDGITAANREGATIVAAVLAVTGGGLVVTAIFDAIDRESRAAASIASAGDILRGGAWIGALERIAVFGALVARSPEGVAIVLAIKGLGRYPELGRDAGTSASRAVAERFIIGTLASFVWAGACALALTSPV